MENSVLDILKILFCAPFLIYACYSDIKKRSVNNNVWLIMLVGSIFFISFDYSLYKILILRPLFISAGFIFILAYILFTIGAFGGADAKALIVLSLTIPAYPGFQVLGYAFPLDKPLYDIFTLSIFGNAALLAIVVPIGLAAYNITKMGLHIDNPAYIFMGYKKRISELPGKHIRLIQGFEMVNGTVRSRFKWGGMEINGDTVRELKHLSGKGLIEDEVWVTPCLPFMIPITLGFFTAVLYGDMMFELIKFLL
ncbi:MAG: A24 family peptidase C-terminal domain-containing protein [Candidatus Methanoperedens sp.]|nr:A24 family peptidase C-terminal domain-containing protein [Candidatus Methanoperedens sp.]